ncbi:MAG: phytanoyl-CoA dioxygenase family protein [Candidatus Latescibacteria bacterium]|jgi:phytanoyl-CoA hydroxylase|nr:phytanoyl-CoA dioxygenase family protein [Candidatus Latescibacterota bacterium]
MIDPEALNQYRTNGWVTVENVFEGWEVDRIAEIALQVSRSEETSGEEVRSYRTDISAEGDTAPRKIEGPFFKHQAFQSFVLDERLESMLKSILGAKPLLKGDQIFMKPPHFGSAKPYHQDNFYFDCHPGDHVITAWIALDDVDEANGCLRYVSGSHREGVLPHEPLPGQPYDLTPTEDRVDLNRETTAPVKKGGVVFHHSEALHTSHRNTSDRWRRAYATHWVTADVTTTTDALERAYFNLPEFHEIVTREASK